MPDFDGLSGRLLAGRGVSRRTLLRWSAGAGVAAAVAPLLAACGGDDDDDTPTPAAASTATTAVGAPTATTGGGATTPTSAETGEATSTTATSPETPTVAAEAATPTESGEAMAAVQVLRLPDTEPPRLDPHLISSYAEIFITTAIFDGLIEITRDGEVLPLAAASWNVSDDGTLYTFTIQPDGLWTDGSLVTANDFEYSFLRMLDPATACPVALFGYNIKNGFEFNSGTVTDPASVGVKAVDDSTLTVELTGPAPFFIKEVALYSFPAVPQGPIEQFGDKWVEPGNIVSNGPFKLDAWEHDVQVTLARNDDYHLDKAKLDTVEWHILTDQVAPYENDELDVSGTISFADAERVMTSSTLSPEVVKYPSSGIQFIACDCGNTDAPIGKAAVRQALYLAIDRDVIVQQVLQGLVEPAPVIMPPGIVGRNLDAIPTGGPDAARKLLADAGYADGNGVELTLQWSQNPSNDLLGQILQQMWQDELGIKVTLMQTEAGAFRAWRGSLSDTTIHYDCYLIGNGTDFEDPYNYHVQLFQSDQGDFYRFRWVNEDYDNLAKAEAVELDPAKREQIALQADALLSQDMPAIPLYYLHASKLVKPYVRDLLWPHLSTDRFLHKAWIAEH